MDSDIDGLSFSYDDLNILGVIDGKVFVEGTYFDKVDHKECYLEFSKDLFKETLTLWLKDKEKYCESYGHFCGVMGSIRASKFKRSESTFNNIIVFEVYEIESNCDMEHG